jgi:hypothetical protein
MFGTERGPATYRKYTVQIFQTNDVIEARTCRRAQFAGVVKEVMLGGVSITGLVHSVREETLIPGQWTIAIIPKAIPAFKSRRSVVLTEKIQARSAI